MKNENSGSSPHLLRTLSLTAAIMIVAGSVIGSGIFRKPSVMAGQLLSPELLILVWIIAGVITFIGALVNAEVAGMIHKTGGQYNYFREMYGDLIGYLYGWSIFAVIQTGSLAAIAYVFAEYLGYFFVFPEAPDALKNFELYIPLVGKIYPFYEFGFKLVAILAIVFLTAINYVGVIFGGFVQTLITIIKILSIVFLSAALLLFGDGSTSNLYYGFSIKPEIATNIFTAFGLATAGAFWAYDGWNNVTFVSGEIKNPQRNVPLALLYGVAIVVALYVAINMAFLYVLPIEVMKDSPLVAATAAEKVFGQNGGIIIALAVVISAFGALNGNLLATARVQFAMARTNLFFKSLGKIHPRYSTPHVSLVAQGIWSSVLVMSGTFDVISDYVVFAAWFFYMLGAFGVFILRKKYPDKYRPYKVWGYPITPIIFVVFSFLFLTNSLIYDYQNSMFGAILILLGLPVYFYWKKHKRMGGVEEEL